MNVIKIDMIKIKQAIREYIYYHTNWIMQTNTTINFEYPIVFMNEDTFSQIQKEQSFLIKEKCYSKPQKKIFGCHIAIADWLPFGEIQLK